MADVKYTELDKGGNQTGSFASEEDSEEAKDLLDDFFEY